MTAMSNHNRVTVSIVGCQRASDMAAVSPEVYRIAVKFPLVSLLHDLKQADACGYEKVVVPITAETPNLDSDAMVAIGISTRIFVDSNPSSVRSIVFVVAGSPLAFSPILEMLNPVR